MPDICMYYQVHQPYRLKKRRLFDIGSDREFFDDPGNSAIVRRVADKCYVPAVRMLRELVRDSDRRFKIALSLTGTLLDQLARDAPDALEEFQRLVDGGGVELLAETHAHSLTGLVDPGEFEQQVALHRETVARWFGQSPRVFRNTELIVSDELAPTVARLGFVAALVEGADHVLGWRSPNHVYRSGAAPSLKLLPRNYSLSDDIGFRFSNRDWSGWPLTADRYADWLAGSPGESVHIFLDFETFGEHQWHETGIFDFLRHLPRACEARGLTFVHPSRLAEREPVGELWFGRPTSWADVDRDVTAWLGNRMQRAAHERLYGLRDRVREAGDPALLDTWRRLSTSDHFYYMCTKWSADGDVHKYFSPFETPYDAFIAYMNVLQDLEQVLAELPAVPLPVPAGPMSARAAARAPRPYQAPALAGVASS